MARNKKNSQKTQKKAKPAMQVQVNLNADQIRAKYALEKVTAITTGTDALPADVQKEFKTYVQSLPAMVQINGIGQAIAFYRSRFTKDPDKQGGQKKGSQAYRTLYELVSDWLCKGELAVYKSNSDLLYALVSEDMQKYRMAQTELLEFLGWVQKFSLAFIETEKNGETEEV